MSTAITLAVIAAAIVLIALAFWCGLTIGISRGMTYASDRHAGIDEGRRLGRRERQPEIDELRARVVRLRGERDQLTDRVARMRAEVAAIDAALTIGGRS